MKNKTPYLILPACLAAGVSLVGASAAVADSGAQGVAGGSPGVISGNLAQVPVHVPVNLCGNTVDVVGLLNPVFGNQCANGGGTGDRQDDRGDHGPGGKSHGQDGSSSSQGPGHQGPGNGDGSHQEGGAPKGSAPETAPVQKSPVTPHQADSADHEKGSGSQKHSPSQRDEASDQTEHGREKESRTADAGAQGPSEAGSVGAGHSGHLDASVSGRSSGGFAPVGASEVGPSLAEATGPAQSAPSEPALAHTGANDQMGLLAMGAAALIGTGVMALRRTRSSNS
ncbi:chaplin family protein [Streptomyces sp. NPDC058534]|uniref:chaplin n=1 Tax=Streptomyces sp. NPDC058534 TaxID=3346541 RepID=UPI003649F372